MSENKCPFHHSAGSGPSNRDWWPNQLRPEILHQHVPQSSPMGGAITDARSFEHWPKPAQTRMHRNASSRTS